jgi:predicted GTPase
MTAILQVEDLLRKDGKYNDKQRRKIVDLLKDQRLNILIVGATGSGKSSTINALFDLKRAQVGLGADPETTEIKKHELGQLVLWDSPGLGDGKKEDKSHLAKIVKKLKETTNEDHALIDLVLVVIDGSSRDLGTSYTLINDTIIPNLGENPEKRIIVAMNQADLAFKGADGWDRANNKPTRHSLEFLDQKVASIKYRIKDSTGVEIEPIYYCAGYQNSSSDSSTAPYNLTKLLWLIVESSPAQKRLIIRDSLAPEEINWETDDNKKDYRKEVKSKISTGGFFSLLGGFLGSLFGF